MAVKTLLLLISFVFCSVGALFSPMIGVVGYVAHYHIWPDEQWWGRDIAGWGLRYAFTIGLCLLIGMLLNKHKLKLGRSAMRGHEWLLVAFWLVALISIFTGLDLTFRPYDHDHQRMLLDKLSKVILFCLMMSHLVTTLRRVDLLFWTLIIGTLYTGYQAWDAPLWKFNRARLDGIGGPDFRESSYLGAHFAMMLPLVAIQFLRGGWKAKAFCAVVGGFAVNGLILTRTRAAFLAVCAGVLASLLLSLRGRRRKIFLYLLPGLLAGGYLSDAGFRERMRTIEANPGEEDSSAANRLMIWRATGQMLLDHPLGVGAGNFRLAIGRYLPEFPRRDAHNTFLRCAAELGIFGIGLLAATILSAFACLYRARRLAWQCPYNWQIRYYVYGLAVSLVIMLTAGLFMTQLYIEEFWWMLTLPVCLLRAAELEYARTRESPELAPDETDHEPEPIDELAWAD
ncbi:MAG: O-antigen ligase family protein, partial [Planctomycetes bacterium]|nr:O-antigen ligase family protein [Planctomycetota bacterium]